MATDEEEIPFEVTKVERTDEGVIIEGTIPAKYEEFLDPITDISITLDEEV